MEKLKNNLRSNRNKAYRPLRISSLAFPEQIIKAAQWVHVLLWGLLGLIIVFSIVNFFFPHLLWSHFVFIHHPFHSTIESLGAIAAILIALMPLQMLFDKSRPSYIFLSCGFLVMGLLDLFHSFYGEGHGFVFTHAIAILSGSFFFALFIFPWNFNAEKVKKYMLSFFGLSTILFAILASQNRGAFPEMVHDGVFTTTANNINLLAGILFLVGAVKLTLLYIREKNLGILILAFTALVSAIVGITFQYSTAWSDSWWLWHAIRLIAFLAVLGYMFWRIQALSNERNLALESLKESEKQFRIIFENSPLGKSRTGLDGSLNINKAFSGITGYSQEELQQRDWREVTHPDDIKESEDVVKALIAGEMENARFEKRYRHKKGHYVWTEVTTTLHHNEAGEAQFFITTISDISKRKEIEEQVKHSEEKFRNLFNSVSIPLCHVREDGMIESLNKRFEHHLGYTIEDIPTIDHWWEKAYPDKAYRERVMKNWQESVEKSIENQTDIKSDVYNVSCKNGEIRQIIIGGITINNDLLATFIDVTEQRKAEQQILKSESMLKTAQQIARVGNWELDIVNDKLYWSDEIYRIFGLEPQEFDATYEAFLEHIHPDDRNTVNEAYSNSLETKEPYEIVHRILLKDGTLKFVKEKCDTDFADDGTPLRSVGIVQDITAQKKNEEKLEQEKEFTDSVINTMPGVFYLFDQNGKFLKWNNTLAELSGLSFEEVGTRLPLDFIAPTSRQKVGEAIERAFLEGDILVEADFLAKGQSPIPFLFSGKIIERDNEPLLVGIGIDISKRLQAEEERKKAMHALNERMKEITCLFEINEAIKDKKVSLTEVMEEITQIIPKGWHYPENTSVKIALDSEEYKSKPYKPSDEYLLERVIIDGRDRGLLQVFVFDLDSEQSKTPFLEEEKKLVKTIADNISIYVSRIENEQAIKESEENFRNVYSNSPVSIWQEDWTDIIRMVEGLKKEGVKDFNNYFNENKQFVDEALSKVIINDVNQATLEMFEADSKDELVKSLGVVFATEDTLPGFIGELLALAEGKHVYETEMKLNTAKGNLINTMLRMSFPSEEVPDGQVLVSIMDITALKIAREQLNESLENLKRSNKELERFAYVASHDLQEPLRMVSSYTQLLERRYKGQLDERADKYIYYAVDGATRMQNLINDLLSFSRISTRGDKFTNTDTSKIIEHVLGDLSVRIEESGAEIDIGEMPVIKADASQIERLFLNLLGNALKFKKPDEKPIIRIDAKQQQGQWLFSVKDNGIGIDEKFKEKVFVIFQRLHGAAEYKGTGIGLAICKRIVQRHGGEIWFESEENKGTTFFFTLKSNTLNIDDN